MNVKKWIKARFKAKVRPNWHRSRWSRYPGQEAASRQWDAVIINSYFFLGGRCRRHPMEATGYNQHPPPPSFPFVQSGRRDSLEHVCSTVGWLIASSFSSLARHFPLPVFFHIAFTAELILISECKFTKSQIGHTPTHWTPNYWWNRLQSITSTRNFEQSLIVLPVDCTLMSQSQKTRSMHSQRQFEWVSLWFYGCCGSGWICCRNLGHFLPVDDWPYLLAPIGRRWSSFGPDKVESWRRRANPLAVGVCKPPVEWLCSALLDNFPSGTLNYFRGIRGVCTFG